MKKIFCLCPEGHELGNDEKTCIGNGILNVDNILLEQENVLYLHLSLDSFISKCLFWFKIKVDFDFICICIAAQFTSKETLDEFLRLKIH